MMKLPQQVIDAAVPIPASYAPFDPNLVMHDNDGNALRYINHPLDEHFSIPLGEYARDGMLPPEHYEVERTLLELKIFTERADGFGLFDKLFVREKFALARARSAEKAAEVMELVNSSPEHKAAIRRIVNGMPPNNSGREVLAPFIANSVFK